MSSEHLFEEPQPQTAGSSKPPSHTNSWLLATGSIASAETVGSVSTRSSFVQQGSSGSTSVRITVPPILRAKAEDFSKNGQPIRRRRQTQLVSSLNLKPTKPQEDEDQTIHVARRLPVRPAVGRREATQGAVAELPPGPIADAAKTASEDVATLKAAFDQYPRYRDILHEAVEVIEGRVQTLVAATSNRTMERKREVQNEKDRVARAPHERQIAQHQESVEKALDFIRSEQKRRQAFVAEEEQNISKFRELVKSVKAKKDEERKEVRELLMMIAAMFEQQAQNTMEIHHLSEMEEKIGSLLEYNKTLSHDTGELQKELQRQRIALAQKDQHADIYKLKQVVEKKGALLPGKKIALQRLVAAKERELKSLNDTLQELRDRNATLTELKNQWEDMYRAREAVELRGWTPRPQYADATTLSKVVDLTNKSTTVTGKPTEILFEACCKKYLQYVTALRRSQEDHVRFSQIVAPISAVRRFLYLKESVGSYESSKLNTSTAGRKSPTHGDHTMSPQTSSLLNESGKPIPCFGVGDEVPYLIAGEEAHIDEQWGVLVADRFAFAILKYMAAKAPTGTVVTKHQLQELSISACQTAFGAPISHIGGKILNLMKYSLKYQEVSPLCKALQRVLNGTLHVRFLEGPMSFVQRFVSQLGAEVALKNAFVLMTKEFNTTAFGAVELMQLRYALSQDAAMREGKAQIIRPSVLTEWPEGAGSGNTKLQQLPNFGFFYRAVIFQYLHQQDFVQMKIDGAISTAVVASELIPDTVLINPQDLNRWFSHLMPLVAWWRVNSFQILCSSTPKI